MKRFLPLILLLLPMAAEALVIRADVDDAHYQIMGSAFPALVDLPDEGHGVLIAPQWVLTTAQAATAQPIQRVVIDGVSREVRSVQIHPGYRPLPDASAEATAVAHARAVRATLAGRDDLALIRLASPVGGVKPVALYRGSDELGHSVRLIGKGASGDGERGALADSLPRAQLRVASNVIDKVDPRWLFYRFDPPATASSHEGMIGRGDQGGPLLLEANGRWELAGLASWPLRHADPQRAGRYGDGGYNLRVSRYLRWIEAVIAAYEPEAGAHARARAG